MQDGFSNQFALSVELTRLLPPVAWAANKTYNALMSRARDLRHSGSDIVVEEDLAIVFGRCRISPTLTSSFKTIVTRSNSNVPLMERVMLQGGPGPTVIRAFQESPYFAMVVQLSLLVWTFHSEYLATHIADALRKRLEGAPLSSVPQSSPDRIGILGVLRACESQTSAFNWNMMLNAVSTTLGHRADKAPIDFPPFVLQGLLDMFPAVQTLPSDRLIHIQIPVGENLESGTSTLVVWAHQVLGLTVLVRRSTNNGQSKKNIRFGGSDSEQVFIEEVTADDEACIVLLDAQKEHLLTIKAEPDAESELIGAVRRIPAKGWGNALLADELGHLHSYRRQSMAVFEDLQNVTSAFAFIIAKSLVKDDSDRDHDKNKPTNFRRPMAYHVDEQRVLQASRFLFDNPHISRGTIDRYAAQYSFQALNQGLPHPPALAATQRADVPAEKHEVIVEDEWTITCDSARALAVFLLALANVVDLQDCEDLMFAGCAFSSIRAHTLVQQLDEWNGRDTLRIPDDAWLQAVAIPLLGHQEHVWSLPWGKVCLICDRRWSAWVSTFGDLDPAYTGAGSVRLGRGSPCRNGVWKAFIYDSTSNSLQLMTDPERAESCGQVTSLRCAEKVTLDSPYCGEGVNAFVVCARLRHHRSIQKQTSLTRVGFKALQRYLWWAHLSQRCSHGSRTGADIKLAIDCATIAGYGNYLYETEERILIYLTAHSKGARWLALATVQYISVGKYETEDLGARSILLRGDDCCFQCAIDQAAAQPGKWFIIL